jgi:hypothetical protein
MKTAGVNNLLAERRELEAFVMVLRQSLTGSKKTADKAISE